MKKKPAAAGEEEGHSVFTKVPLSEMRLWQSGDLLTQGHLLLPQVSGAQSFFQDNHYKMPERKACHPTPENLYQTLYLKD